MVDKPKRFRSGIVVLFLISILLFSGGCSILGVKLPSLLVTPTAKALNATQAVQTQTTVSNASFEQWVATLQDFNGNKSDRVAAVQALGNTKDPRTVAPLITALSDWDMDVWIAAETALGEIGAPAVEPLIAALKDVNSPIRVQAARTLGYTKDPRAVEPLIATMKDDGVGLYSISGPALVEIGAPAVEPLIATLRNEDHNIRYWSADVLRQIKDIRAVEPLIEAMNDPDVWVKGMAIRALGEIKDTRAIEPLITALDDPDFQIWLEAENALVGIGVPAIEPVIAAMKSDSTGGRIEAEKVLGRIGAPAVVSLLEALKDENAFVRTGAAEALGQIKDSSAVDPLIAALKDGDPNVQAAALTALVQIGGTAREAALTDENLAIIANAYASLITIGAQDSEALLIKSLNQFGGKEMLEAFLNCGNTLLEDAGREWAVSRGYTITSVPSTGKYIWGTNR
jgi:HEAT repeat protein